MVARELIPGGELIPGMSESTRVGTDQNGVGSTRDRAGAPGTVSQSTSILEVRRQPLGPFGHEVSGALYSFAALVGTILHLRDEWSSDSMSWTSDDIPLSTNFQGSAALLTGQSSI